MNEAPAFTYIGLDYLGPLYVRSTSEKTFKSASKELEKIMNDPSVIRYFTQERIRWSYILEKAPWWGGFYERLVKSLKSSLKKTIGRAKLTQDELVTVVAEAEMILNCQPISYVSSEDVEEPLSPAHLIIGRRISALPDEDFGISQNDLSRRERHLNMILGHFWKRWRAE